MFLWLIHACGCLVFHCVSIPQSTFAFYCWQAICYFDHFSIRFFGESMCVFLLHTYVELEMLGHRVHVCRHCHTVFPSDCVYFYIHHCRTRVPVAPHPHCDLCLPPMHGLRYRPQNFYHRALTQGYAETSIKVQSRASPLLHSSASWVLVFVSNV